jgi:uncharacterized protein (TIGR03435 family)
MAVVTVCAQSGGKPKFEVASVKPCKVNMFGTRGGESDPGRIAIHCQAVVNILRQAYATFGDGKMNRDGAFTKVDGGPQWAYNDLWEIAATSGGRHAGFELEGPMMQSLLEERFKLKVHRETRQIPVYALTVAKGGLKLPAAKRACFTPGAGRPPDLPRDELRLLMCGGADARKDEFHMHGASIGDLAYALSRIGFDRKVVDRTGVSGQFDIDFKWGMVDGDQTKREDVVLGYQFALAKLGIKMEPAMGPGEFIVIDHVERPTEN